MKIGYVCAKYKHFKNIQIEVLKEISIDDLVIESDNRNELNKLIDRLNENDEIVVLELDRVASNYQQLLELNDEIKTKGIYLTDVFGISIDDIASKYHQLKEMDAEDIEVLKLEDSINSNIYESIVKFMWSEYKTSS